MFRFKKSVPVEYDRQGYIYFTSKRYRGLPAREQERILRLCVEAGGECYKALFEFVTTNSGATGVCERNFISLSTLERIVQKYYVLFDAEL